MALGYVYLRLLSYQLERPLSNTCAVASKELLKIHLVSGEMAAASMEEQAAGVKEHS